MSTPQVSIANNPVSNSADRPVRRFYAPGSVLGQGGWKRGEVPVPPSGNTGGKSPSVVRPDWVRFSCPWDDESEALAVLAVSDALGEVCRAVHRLSKEGAPKGWIGFERSAEIVTEAGEVIGRMGWGGNKGRGCVDLSGVGCGLVRDWDALRLGVERMRGRLTRVDLAADFLDGAVSVDDALRSYHAGEFNQRGCPPSARLIDDLGSNAGRTLYVGSGKASKMARIYEKGKQLGERQSRWVRVEAQFKRDDFDLPLEMLTSCATYLAGAYPVFKRWLDCAADVLHASKHKAMVETQKAVHIARQQAGRIIAFLTKTLGWTSSRVVRSIEAREPSDRVIYRGWEGLPVHMDAPAPDFLPVYEAVPA